MALPQDLLRRLGALEGPLTEVRNAVDDAISARGDRDARRTIGELIDGVESATERWLTETEEIGRELLAYWEQQREDRNDAQVRLGGLSMLHLAVAEDVAVLTSTDGLPYDALISDVPETP